MVVPGAAFALALNVAVFGGRATAFAGAPIMKPSERSDSGGPGLPGSAMLESWNTIVSRAEPSSRWVIRIVHVPAARVHTAGTSPPPAVLSSIAPVKSYG